MALPRKPNLVLRVSDELRERLTEIAQALGLTVSEVARRAIEEYIARKEHILKLPKGSPDRQFLLVLQDYLTKLEVNPSVAVILRDEDPFFLEVGRGHRPGPSHHYEFEEEMVTDGDVEFLGERREYEYPYRDDTYARYRVSSWNWIVVFGRYRSCEHLDLGNADEIRAILRPELFERTRDALERTLKDRAIEYEVRRAERGNA